MADVKMEKDGQVADVHEDSVPDMEAQGWKVAAKPTAEAIVADAAEPKAAAKRTTLGASEK